LVSLSSGPADSHRRATNKGKVFFRQNQVQACTFRRSSGIQRALARPPLHAEQTTQDTVGRRREALSWLHFDTCDTIQQSLKGHWRSYPLPMLSSWSPYPSGVTDVSSPVSLSSTSSPVQCLQYRLARFLIPLPPPLMPKSSLDSHGRVSCRSGVIIIIIIHITVNISALSSQPCHIAHPLCVSHATGMQERRRPSRARVKAPTNPA
jgi:hypothetical protein